MNPKIFLGSKKGIFFTLAAIALAVIILLSLSVYRPYELKEQIDVVAVRIDTMNNFIKDVEQDLEKGIFIASFRAFASMDQYVATNGSFVSDITGSFNGLIINGTLNGQQLSLMKDSTLTDWIGKIKTQADKIGILVNFTIVQVTVNQSDPWLIDVNANLNFSVVDKKGTSSWARNKSITTQVGIENFEDPIYIIKSAGRITNTIKKSPITQFVQNGDVTNLMIHTNKSYYIESNLSPNFIMRLQGDFSNSTTGIESLVNVQKFIDNGVATKDRSVVDYIYFGTQNTVNHMINNTPSWFKIDDAHLSIYEVQGLVTS